MQTIHISHKRELTPYFIQALEELPNNSGRIVHILERIDNYIESGLIEIKGELKFEWQIQAKWVKTKLKNTGIIQKHYKVGSMQFWTFCK